MQLQPRWIPFIGVAFLFACMPTSASSSPVTFDFEHTPNGGTPVDDQVLANPYSYSGGSVRFFFDVNGDNKYEPGTDANPVFEHVGPDDVDGFTSNVLGTEDTARQGFGDELGKFFLRTPAGNGGSLPGPFIAEYTTINPIDALSGEIWDIDGNPREGSEQWRFDVLDRNGVVLASQLSPEGTTEGVNSLDSLPWTFHFNGLSSKGFVEDLRLTFIGTKTSGIAVGLQ